MPEVSDDLVTQLLIMGREEALDEKATDEPTEAVVDVIHAVPRTIGRWGVRGVEVVAEFVPTVEDAGGDDLILHGSNSSPDKVGLDRIRCGVCEDAGHVGEGGWVQNYTLEIIVWGS